MAELITIFTSSTGLNTADAEYRTAKDGVCEFSESLNMSLDKTGRPSLRNGLVLKQAGNYHSLYVNRNVCYVVGGDTLYRMAKDTSLTALRSGLATGVRMSYAQAGNRTYFSNGIQNGYIENDVAHDWTQGEYFNAETNRKYAPVPVGNHLEIHSSRMYIAVDNVLFWSERFRYDLFRVGRNAVQFTSKILMIKSVDSGMFVSTEHNTYFLAGLDPFEFRRIPLLPYPAIEWSVSTERISSIDLGLDSFSLGILWASTEGLIYGTDSGQVINFNKEKINYPEDVQIGFGCLMDYNFIHGVK